jgi:hypothetical protein
MPVSTIPGAGITSSTTLTTPIVATTMGVGGATPAASGSGITFPATQSASTNANTLDDYEEGTWTPIITSENGSLSAYTSSGAYTKIGNTVYVSGTFNITTTGSASGYALMTGYPFTSASTFKTQGICREGASSGDYYGTLMNASVTGGFILGFSGNGPINWTSGRTYDWNFTYRAA